MVRTFQYKKYVDTSPHTMSTGNFIQFFALNYRVFRSNGKSKQKFALIYRSFLSGGKFTQFFALIYRVFLSNGKFTEKMRKFIVFIYKNSSPSQTCHLLKETKSFLSLWTLNEWGYITLSFKVQSEWQVCVMSWVIACPFTSWGNKKRGGAVLHSLPRDWWKHILIFWTFTVHLWNWHSAANFKWLKQEIDSDSCNSYATAKNQDF